MLLNSESARTTFIQKLDKRMKRQKLLILAFWLLSPILGISQDTLVVSKKDIWEKSLHQSSQLKIAEKNVEIAKADVEKAKALFLPSVSVSHIALSTTNPLMSFGSKLNQEILSATDFNPALLNDPAVTTNFATKIEVLQPLVNVDGIYERKAAIAKVVAYQFQTQRTEEYLKLEIKKAYMQLQLSYNTISVLQKALNTIIQYHKLIENYMGQGLAQEADKLSIGIRVSDIKTQIAQTQSQIRALSDFIGFLTADSLKGRVLKPDELLVEEIEYLDLQSNISNSRKDLIALTKTTEAYQNMLIASKYSFLPRLNAFANYEMYDRSFFNISAKGYTVGLALTWALFDGNKSVGKYHQAEKALEKAKLEQHQYREQSELEQRKIQRQLADLSQKLITARISIQQAQEAYRIRLNRYQQGLEKTTDVLNAETLVSQKELEYAQVVFEFNFNKLYLEFLTK